MWPFLSVAGKSSTRNVPNKTPLNRFERMRYTKQLGAGAMALKCAFGEMLHKHAVIFLCRYTKCMCLDCDHTDSMCALCTTLDSVEVVVCCSTFLQISTSQNKIKVLTYWWL